MLPVTRRPVSGRAIDKPRTRAILQNMRRILRRWELPGLDFVLSTITWNPPVAWTERLAVALFLDAFFKGLLQFLRAQVFDQRIALALVYARLVDGDIRTARKPDRNRGQPKLPRPRK